MVSSVTFYLSTLQMMDSQFASNSFPWLRTRLQWITLHMSPYGAFWNDCQCPQSYQRESHIPTNTWNFHIFYNCQYNRQSHILLDNFLYLLMIINIFHIFISFGSFLYCKPRFYLVASSLNWVFISLQFLFYFFSLPFLCWFAGVLWLV